MRERRTTMSRRLSIVFVALMASGLMCVGCQAQGESYPSKPIEFVSHSSAGSASDILCRTTVDILSKEKIVTQPLAVVNKTGGSSAVATAYVAEKKRDPYFVYHITTTQVTTPISTGSIGMSALTPICNLYIDANAIAVAADSPYKTLKDLVDASKSGTKITWGGGSVTATENMNRFLINKHMGAQIEFISYEGGGDAIAPLLGGHIQVVQRRVFELNELVRANKVRLVAVPLDKRIDLYPDVPTVKELGGNSVPPGFRGWAMPGDVPLDTLKYWENAFQKMRGTQAWKKFLEDGALTDYWIGPKEFVDFLEVNHKEYESVMREMGLLKK